MFMAVRSEAQSQGILSGPMRTGAGPHGRHPRSMAVPQGGSRPGVHVRPYMYMNQPPYETAIGWRHMGRYRSLSCPKTHPPNKHVLLLKFSTSIMHRPTPLVLLYSCSTTTTSRLLIGTSRGTVYYNSTVILVLVPQMRGHVAKVKCQSCGMAPGF